MKPADVLPAVFLYDDHVSTLDRQAQEIATLKAQLAATQQQLAAALDKAQMYEGLYRDEMNRQAREARR